MITVGAVLHGSVKTVQPSGIDPEHSLDIEIQESEADHALKELSSIPYVQCTGKLTEAPPSRQAHALTNEEMSKTLLEHS